jgi:hypothetical protein
MEPHRSAADALEALQTARLELIGAIDALKSRVEKLDRARVEQLIELFGALRAANESAEDVIRATSAGK